MYKLDFPENEFCEMVLNAKKIGSNFVIKGQLSTGTDSTSFESSETLAFWN